MEYSKSAERIPAGHDPEGRIETMTRPSKNPVEADANKLTDRQKQILDFIDRYVNSRGFPPTVREIKNAVGLQSTSSVHAQLKNLEQAGRIVREPSRPRALGIPKSSSHSGQRKRASQASPQVGRKPRKNETVKVPLLGRIAAGSPRQPAELLEDTIDLHWTIFPEIQRHDIEEENLFLLRVSGDSMVGAGINDGDLVVVRRQPTARPGDVVVAIVEDEATVKRLRVSDSAIALEPANPYYSPIEADPFEVQIIGKVVGLVRPKVT